MKGCDITDCTSDPAHMAGVDFSVQECFLRGLDASSEAQVKASASCLESGGWSLWAHLAALTNYDSEPHHILFELHAAMGLLSRS